MRLSLNSATLWRLTLQMGVVLDATRMSDGKMVLLKKVNTDIHPHEVEISRFLSSEGLASDPRNHCVPLLDVLPDPNEEHTAMLVLPLLRSYDSPGFVTVGEVVACLQQLIEVSMSSGNARLIRAEIASSPQGLHFMHTQHVAHRYVSMFVKGKQAYTIPQ